MFSALSLLVFCFLFFFEALVLAHMRAPRSMSASNARAFKYHTGLLKVITCNLRGLPYRMNLGVMIFNDRSI